MVLLRYTNKYAIELSVLIDIIISLADLHKSIGIQFGRVHRRALSYEPILFWWRTTREWMPVL
jgi:hypothetical protein